MTATEALAETLRWELVEPGVMDIRALSILAANEPLEREGLLLSDLIVLVGGVEVSEDLRVAARTAAWGGIRLLVIADDQANVGDPHPSSAAREALAELSELVSAAVTVPVPGLPVERAAAAIARLVRGLMVMLEGGAAPDWLLVDLSGEALRPATRWGLGVGHGRGRAGILPAVDAALEALPIAGPFERIRVDFGAGRPPDTDKVHKGLARLQPHLAPGGSVSSSVRSMASDSDEVRVVVLALGGGERLAVVPDEGPRILVLGEPREADLQAFSAEVGELSRECPPQLCVEAGDLSMLDGVVFARVGAAEAELCTWRDGVTTRIARFRVGSKQVE